ncbi:MAG: hypothetical protein EBR27_06050 [Betaproteobacteria bacterium]|nr:hypothetical protein [Betaproteobacteria bacterium]
MDRLPSGEKTTRREVAIQMGGRLLLVLIGVLQLVAIVQSESTADTVLHGGILLVLIVFGTRKAKNRKSLRGGN